MKGKVIDRGVENFNLPSTIRNHKSFNPKFIRNLIPMCDSFFLGLVFTLLHLDLLSSYCSQSMSEVHSLLAGSSQTISYYDLVHCYCNQSKDTVLLLGCLQLVPWDVQWVPPMGSLGCPRRLSPIGSLGCPVGSLGFPMGSLGCPVGASRCKSTRVSSNSEVLWFQVIDVCI